MANLDIGDQVTFPGKRGARRKGVIHAVRKADNPDGSTRVLSYLIDTGKDVRVDIYTHSTRAEEVGKRFETKTKGKKLSNHKQGQILDEILQSDDLPEDKITEEKVRQPEQVDVPAEDVQPSE